jgi:glycosyltransferase involved in cell wall biosynthesis/peptidoglycan/xylan/chitin deacetylase (PgdA/CDA1 family)
MSASKQYQASSLQEAPPVHDPGSQLARYQVICVCGGYGFPLGSASASRITVVGKALQEAGIRFLLLHCGPSPVVINTQRSGVYEGIPFEYTASVRRPKNKIARLLVYMWAAAGLAVRLARLGPARHNTVVYLYVMDGPLCLYTGYLCRWLGLPVVQEFCEWIPGDLDCSPFTRWLYNKLIFNLATGALVISKIIEERVRKQCVEANPHLLVHRIPAIVDTKRFTTRLPVPDSSSLPSSTFVYCGTWINDIFFLIRALALVRRGGYECKLRIIGSCAEQSGQSILNYATENGLSPQDIVLSGCVDQRTLATSYQSAAGLLMPLWNDDRSLSRLPNKLGEYLASGRPVVAGKIGDLTGFLVDNVNAYLGEPGDESEVAHRMIAILRDPDRAQAVGGAGQQACVAHLDYRPHARGLAQFFARCIDDHQERLAIRKARGQVRRLPMVLRNCFCGLLALGLIASGRVRRARSQALGGDVVTAIYFHKPNQRLFFRCIRWLIKYGYTFISVNDLMDILYLGKTPPRGAVWLSIDDGCKEILASVLPLVRRENIPITLFIPSGIVEGDGLFPWLHPNRSEGPHGVSVLANTGVRDSVTVAELKYIATYPGATIGSHTVSHAVTVNLTAGRARFELGECKRTLESWTRAEVQCFAYPEGRFDGREREFLAEFGYRLAATTENAFVNRESNPYLVPRFSVADEISFPEAICNMVGVWRPAISPLIQFFRRSGRISTLFWGDTQHDHRSQDASKPLGGWVRHGRRTLPRTSGSAPKRLR